MTINLSIHTEYFLFLDRLVYWSAKLQFSKLYQWFNLYIWKINSPNQLISFIKTKTIGSSHQSTPTYRSALLSWAFITLAKDFFNRLRGFNRDQLIILANSEPTELPDLSMSNLRIIDSRSLSQSASNNVF